MTKPPQATHRPLSPRTHSFHTIYDGEGKRVRKYVGENTRFVYGIGGELLAEYNGSTNAITKEYLYGASGLTAVIDPTNGTEYLTPDHLGSPRVVTNSSATVTQRRDFMPFGEEVTSGAGRSSGSGWSSVSAPRQKFTGYERDSESGLDFAQARYFGSSVGRFSSADPYNIVVDSSNRSDLNIYLKNAQNWNRYTYSLNNPLKIVDPSGLTPEPAFDWNKLSADERRILENSEFTVKQMIGENLEPIKLTGEALFDHLAANNPAALAGFLNQTAQLASITFNVDGGSRSALSFVDSVVGIAPDRIYATVGSELRTLVSKDPRFSRAPGHEGYDDSWKDNRSLKGNLQASFSKDGRGLDADTDLYNIKVKNPLKKIVGAIGHGVELIGTRGDAVTNPYSVYDILRSRGVKLSYEVNR